MDRFATILFDRLLPAAIAAGIVLAVLMVTAQAQVRVGASVDISLGNERLFYAKERCVGAFPAQQMRAEYFAELGRVEFERLCPRAVAIRRQGRGTPRCPANSVFHPEYGKCVGTVLHDIPLAAQQKEYFAGCDEIETRHIMRGNKLVQQQRCKR